MNQDAISRIKSTMLRETELAQRESSYIPKFEEVIASFWGSAVVGEDMMPKEEAEEIRYIFNRFCEQVYRNYMRKQAEHAKHMPSYFYDIELNPPILESTCVDDMEWWNKIRVKNVGLKIKEQDLD